MKQKPLVLLYGILSLILLAIIWGNSLQPATTSNAVSLGLLAKFQTTFTSIFGVDFPISNHILRKAGHFSEFLLFGFFITSTCLTISQKKRQTLPIALYIGLLVAVLDETIQNFVPGRGPQVTDVLIDHTGYFVGLLLSVCIVKQLNAFLYKIFTKKAM